MENRTRLIQIRATQDEKALFKQKGGSEAFREWLHGNRDVVHAKSCMCRECIGKLVLNK